MATLTAPHGSGHLGPGLGLLSAVQAGNPSYIVKPAPTSTSSTSSPMAGGSKTGNPGTPTIGSPPLVPHKKEKEKENNNNLPQDATKPKKKDKENKEKDNKDKGKDKDKESKESKESKKEKKAAAARLLKVENPLFGLSFAETTRLKNLTTGPPPSQFHVEFAEEVVVAPTAKPKPKPYSVRTIIDLDSEEDTDSDLDELVDRIFSDDTPTPTPTQGSLKANPLLTRSHNSQSMSQLPPQHRLKDDTETQASDHNTGGDGEQATRSKRSFSAGAVPEDSTIVLAPAGDTAIDTAVPSSISSSGGDSSSPAAGIISTSVSGSPASRPLVPLSSPRAARGTFGNATNASVVPGAARPVSFSAGAARPVSFNAGAGSGAATTTATATGAPAGGADDEPDWKRQALLGKGVVRSNTVGKATGAAIAIVNKEQPKRPPMYKAGAGPGNSSITPSSTNNVSIPTTTPTPATSSPTMASSPPTAMASSPPTAMASSPPTQGSITTHQPQPVGSRGPGTPKASQSWKRKALAGKGVVSNNNVSRLSVLMALVDEENEGGGVSQQLINNSSGSLLAQPGSKSAPQIRTGAGAGGGSPVPVARSNSGGKRLDPPQVPPRRRESEKQQLMSSVDIKKRQALQQQRLKTVKTVVSEAIGEMQGRLTKHQQHLATLHAAGDAQQLGQLAASIDALLKSL